MQSTSLNMQRKPGFPVANCSIKMPDGLVTVETGAYEDENEQQQRRQQLINFGHAQWGFNNWNWAVTKQELDFVELTNGKYCAGVVAFVSVTVKSLDLHRENIGYATSNANTKGFAIYKSRKCAVTNALRETLLSFGGSVASELMDLVETQRGELPAAGGAPDLAENNQNLANKGEPKNGSSNGRKEAAEGIAQNMRPHPVKNAAANCPRSPAALPPANRAPLHAPRAPVPLGPAPHAPALHVHAPTPHAPAPHVPTPHAPAPHVPASHAPAPHRPNPNDGKLEGMNEEEARAERKRRQRLAQEEFRLKQLSKHDTDDKRELGRGSSSLDSLLLQIPTQDIEIQESEPPRLDKRRSPAPAHGGKRRASATWLDVAHTD